MELSVRLTTSHQSAMGNMADFNFSTTAQICLRRGGSEYLSDYCQQFDAKRVLLVTDKGIIAAGLLDTPIRALSTSGISVDVFSDVEADPSQATVQRATQAAKNVQADMIIGFGGGSAMDVAKLVSVLAHPACSQAIEDMFGVDQLNSSRLPLLHVPTTAGTGSEVTPIAIITTGETTKAGVVSTRLLPDIALLDARLTMGLPGHITAATGIDAMVHAIEAFTSKIKKNPISDMLAIQALSLLAPNVLKAAKNGADIECREAMLLGACLAGQAFANAPVGAVHALAYPLGGHYHIPHGLSNALVLPHVMRFNRIECEDLYYQLSNVILPEHLRNGSETEQVTSLIDWLANLSADCGLPTTLGQCNIPESALPMLAAEAMLQKRLLVNNPRAVLEHDALTIYQKAYA